MSIAPSRAHPSWLALREPADATARSLDLSRLLGLLDLPQHRTVIHDLGCGAGSMGRWLAPRLSGPQHWVLHDRDQELLDRAVADTPTHAADCAEVTTETRRGDITRLATGALGSPSLVTASALLDMLTVDELDRLVATCAGLGCPVLLTLSVVGRVDIDPAEALDARVGLAFNAHQRRDAGAGNLLGPDAVGRATQAFTGYGGEVHVRPSPWRLGPADAALTTAWFTGWVDAAVAQQPDLSDAAAGYVRRRQVAAAAGELRVTVHHQDLLVLPHRPTANRGDT